MRKERVRKLETKIIGKNKKYAERVQTTNTFVSSIVKKTEDIANTDRAYSNGRSIKNKYNSSQKLLIRIRKR